jgi:hypothetical protein
MEYRRVCLEWHRLINAFNGCLDAQEFFVVSNDAGLSKPVVKKA